MSMDEDPKNQTNNHAIPKIIKTLNRAERNIYIYIFLSKKHAVCHCKQLGDPSDEDAPSSNWNKLNKENKKSTKRGK